MVPLLRMSNVVLESASLERPGDDSITGYRLPATGYRLPRRLTAGEDTLPVHVANTNSTATTGHGHQLKDGTPYSPPGPCHRSARPVVRHKSEAPTGSEGAPWNFIR